jgi:hypothetical protein
MNRYDMERRLQGALDERADEAREQRLQKDHDAYLHAEADKANDYLERRAGADKAYYAVHGDNIPHPDRDFEYLGARLRFYAVALAIGLAVLMVGKAVLAYYF